MDEMLAGPRSTRILWAWPSDILPRPCLHTHCLFVLAMSLFVTLRQVLEKLDVTLVGSGVGNVPSGCLLCSPEALRALLQAHA